MSERHLSLIEIASAASWAPDDPRRLHLEACARCRIVHRRHQQFVTPPTHVPEAELRDAEARLRAFVAGAVEDAGAGAPARPLPSPLPLPRPERRASAWRVPVAFAAAAAVLVVAGALLWPELAIRDERASGRLRGGTRGPATVAPVRRAPRTLADGGVALGWSRVPGADGYTVRLFTPELRALESREAARETVLVLAAGSIAGAGPGDTLLWRVEARRGAQRIAQSDLGTLRAP